MAKYFYQLRKFYVKNKYIGKISTECYFCLTMHREYRYTKRAAFIDR